MRKTSTFLLLIFTQIICSISLADSDLAFPNKSQRMEIAKQLLSGIESIDAITMELRNKTRKIDWHAYKAIATQNIVKSADWSSLYRSLDNLHYGILNRHSYILVDKSIKDQVNVFEKWPRVELGYSWPEVYFFTLNNHKTISAISKVSIEDIFDDFFNLYCNDVHQSGCLRLFSGYMKSGYHFLGGADKLVISYSDGSSETLSKQESEKRKNRAPINCSKLYSSLNLELIYDGSQSCLYQNDETYVLKIFYFGKWGTSYHDIYCEQSNEKGMCVDINEVKRITQNASNKSLVIDIQNNKGGTENTPWIAALTLNGFKDNLIRYKNLNLLSDPTIRSSAFYHSDRAETWYQTIAKKVQNSDEFLPVRPDFCRGSIACDIRTISSSVTPIKYKDLKLVINGKCVSSCDDFIWRTRQYAKAKTYGQLSATDGAYARLDGYLFINNKGEVTNTITGEGNTLPADKGTLLISYRIPISKTVNVDGSSLEGDSTILDHPLSIDKNNFNHLEEDNLKRTLSF